MQELDKPQPIDLDVFRVLAPKGLNSAGLIKLLKLDPYQTRVSSNSIPLTHPRTRRVLPLKEFAEEIIGDSRFAIETSDALVFISRVQNSLESLFFPIAVISKAALRKKGN